jgi:beta-1,4-mannooligosaccharide/beta-1,4-mannosyl-N-acetylglucosamine phosphorylase
VVFPCGWILDKMNGTIRMYYGGADSCLALAVAELSDVLGYLRKCPAPPMRKRAGMVLLD